MRSPSFIIIKALVRLRRRLAPVLILSPLLLTLSAPAQRIAILAPDGGGQSTAYADQLRDGIAAKMQLIDRELSLTAFGELLRKDAYNMTTEQAKLAGARIGCDFMILVRSGVLRRSSFEKAEYYDAFAALYLVSSRTGRLVKWSLVQFDTSTPAAGADLLARSTQEAATAFETAARNAYRSEAAEPERSGMEQPPANDLPASDLRSPLPYLRIKPAYTAEADLYGIAATVEIEVDLAETGKIIRTEIVRWAGYGLDQSVEKAVRTMNWRPAERAGKRLAMRFLLRYNFKKLAKS